MNKNSRSFVSFLCCMFLFFIILAVPSQVSAKGKGSAVITAKNHGITYTCKVCVYNVSYSNQQVAAKAKKVIQQTIKGGMSDAKRSRRSMIISSQTVPMTITVI